MSSLLTIDGNVIEVVYPGLRNHSSGPDFIDAKIRINNTLWVGNVEIHVKSSDWMLHNHHKDENYNNVVLHVVYEYDKPIQMKNGVFPPTLELSIPEKYTDMYSEIMSSSFEIACEKHIQSVNAFTISSWQNYLVIKRLNDKYEVIKQVLLSNNNDWEATFYYFLCGSLGTKLNKDTFIRLSEVTPLKVILKNRDSLITVEAILFGQSGLLSEAPSCEYTDQLKSEYKLMQRKYSLVAMDAKLWKFMKVRPQNFPTIRLSQLANLLTSSAGLFSKVIKANSVIELSSMFRAEVSDYWLNHYTFGEESHFKSKNLGEVTVQSILINCVVPLLFTYGKYINDIDIQERALLFLEQISAESNRVTRKMVSLGLNNENAFYSQSLIELRTNYCDKGGCLNCRIGHEIITKSKQLPSINDEDEEYK